jgi:uncharacterized protein YndB with AHSA1/START domain
MNVSDLPVIIKQEFPNSLAVVWDAITQHHQMTQWFFYQITEFKPEVRFKTQFNVQATSRDFFHIWEITEVIPLKRIVYNWKYKGLKGDSCVIFELTEKDNSTQLTLTTQITEDFDDSIPEFRQESCVGGWNYFLKERLFNYLKQNDD